MSSVNFSPSPRICLEGNVGELSLIRNAVNRKVCLTFRVMIFQNGLNKLPTLCRFIGFYYSLLFNSYKMVNTTN